MTVHSQILQIQINSDELSIHPASPEPPEPSPLPRVSLCRRVETGRPQAHGVPRILLQTVPQRYIHHQLREGELHPDPRLCRSVSGHRGQGAPDPEGAGKWTPRPEHDVTVERECGILPDDRVQPAPRVPLQHLRRTGVPVDPEPAAPSALLRIQAGQVHPARQFPWTHRWTPASLPLPPCALPVLLLQHHDQHRPHSLLPRASDHSELQEREYRRSKLHHLRPVLRRLYSQTGDHCQRSVRPHAHGSLHHIHHLQRHALVADCHLLEQQNQQESQAELIIITIYGIYEHQLGMACWEQLLSSQFCTSQSRQRNTSLVMQLLLFTFLSDNSIQLQTKVLTASGSTQMFCLRAARNLALVSSRAASNSWRVVKYFCSLRVILLVSCFFLSLSSLSLQWLILSCWESKALRVSATLLMLSWQVEQRPEILSRPWMVYWQMSSWQPNILDISSCRGLIGSFWAKRQADSFWQCRRDSLIFCRSLLQRRVMFRSKVMLFPWFSRAVLLACTLGCSYRFSWLVTVSMSLIINYYTDRAEIEEPSILIIRMGSGGSRANRRVAPTPLRRKPVVSEQHQNHLPSRYTQSLVTRGSLSLDPFRASEEESANTVLLSEHSLGEYRSLCILMSQADYQLFCALHCPSNREVLMLLHRSADHGAFNADLSASVALHGTHPLVPRILDMVGVFEQFHSQAIYYTYTMLEHQQVVFLNSLFQPGSPPIDNHYYWIVIRQLLSLLKLLQNQKMRLKRIDFSAFYLRLPPPPPPAGNSISQHQQHLASLSGLFRSLMTRQYSPLTGLLTTPTPSASRSLLQHQLCLLPHSTVPVQGCPSSFELSHHPSYQIGLLVLQLLLGPNELIRSPDKSDLQVLIRSAPSPFQAFLLSWFSFDNNLIGDYAFHLANYKYYHEASLNQAHQAPSPNLYLHPLATEAPAVIHALLDNHLVFIRLSAMGSHVLQSYKAPVVIHPSLKVKEPQVVYSYRWQQTLYILNTGFIEEQQHTYLTYIELPKSVMQLIYQPPSHPDTLLALTQLLLSTPSNDRVLTLLTTLTLYPLYVLPVQAAPAQPLDEDEQQAQPKVEKPSQVTLIDKTLFLSFPSQCYSLPLKTLHLSAVTRSYPRNILHSKHLYCLSHNSLNRTCLQSLRTTSLIHPYTRFYNKKQQAFPLDTLVLESLPIFLTGDSFFLLAYISESNCHCLLLYSPNPVTQVPQFSVYPIQDNPLIAVLTALRANDQVTVHHNAIYITKQHPPLIIHLLLQKQLLIFLCCQFDLPHLAHGTAHSLHSTLRSCLLSDELTPLASSHDETVSVSPSLPFLFFTKKINLYFPTTDSEVASTRVCTLKALYQLSYLNSFFQERLFFPALTYVRHSVNTQQLLITLAVRRSERLSDTSLIEHNNLHQNLKLFLKILTIYHLANEKGIQNQLFTHLQILNSQVNFDNQAKQQNVRLYTLKDQQHSLLLSINRQFDTYFELQEYKVQPIVKCDEYFIDIGMVLFKLFFDYNSIRLNKERFLEELQKANSDLHETNNTQICDLIAKINKQSKKDRFQKHRHLY